ncbi:MAG: right-handed parallel beta-helix repeat-containing protein [Acidobacteria bacterium]|nr:right-handed parallel beta-helix repeat-containing protein [Acidobacteriota bacterium]MCW5948171.1 right-handed parallel beta-helix repeat-containing protein [Pyrinomonadaceae bacterium]
MTAVIATNVVRSKPRPASKGGRRTTYVLIAGSLSLLIGGLGWFDWYSGRLGLIGPQPTIESNGGGGRIIKLPSGGNLQSAIDRAEGGDVIELEPGGIYAGQISLPNKPITEYITIRSAAADKLPEGKRITPADRVNMAVVTSGILGRPAILAENAAHHYRFVGIEFTSAGTIFNYGLVVLGNGEKRPELVPHDIEIDRSYFHPHRPGRSRRGVALNSADTVIKNSYFEGFAVEGEEGQGICGWTGTRNVRVINNYVEGGAQNIMFGGADPPNAEMIPAGIEVRENHLNKPKDWVGKYTIKTIFELKDARNVVFADNLLTNNWIGSAFRITVRNQDGKAPFSTIENVVIRGNVIDNAGDGINILGRDDNFPSQVLRGLTIENNLLLNIGAKGLEGSGYFIQASEGESITIANNTSLNSGNIVTLHGNIPRGFIFRDNITGHGDYGIHAPLDRRSDAAKAMFFGNVFINLNRIDASGFSFPDGNLMVNDIGDVGFTDPAGCNFVLTTKSKFKGKGASIDQIDRWR